MDLPVITPNLTKHHRTCMPLCSRPIVFMYSVLLCGESHKTICAPFSHNSVVHIDCIVHLVKGMVQSKHKPIKIMAK